MTPMHIKMLMVDLHSAATAYGYVHVDNLDTASVNLRLAALEYAHAVFTDTFSRLLDAGEMSRAFENATSTLMQIARERPGSLP